MRAQSDARMTKGTAGFDTERPDPGKKLVQHHRQSHMSEVTAVVAQPKKLKPARKQVKAGQVDKKEQEQPGKEYSP